jgi:cell division protein FtsW (lipid II flippase)
MISTQVQWVARRSRWRLGPRGGSELDWPLLLLALSLALFGILTIWSITQDDPRVESAARKQIVWLCLGIVAGTILLFKDYRFYVKHAYLIYGAVACLLVLTFVIGSRHREVHRWISIPGVPLRIQPSELAKLAVVLALAHILGNRKRPIRRLSDALPVLLLIAPVTFLILKQPDLGTTLVFFPIAGGMLYIAGLPGSYFLFILPMVLGLARPVVSEVGVRSIFSGWFLPWTWFLTLLGATAFAWRRNMHRIDLLAVILLVGGAYFGSPKVWDSLKP